MQDMPSPLGSAPYATWLYILAAAAAAETLILARPGDEARNLGDRIEDRQSRYNDGLEAVKMRNLKTKCDDLVAGKSRPSDLSAVSPTC
jgi:hypothetical protein